MILKTFFFKKQLFSQSLESIQMYSSEYVAADQW